MTDTRQHSDPADPRHVPGVTSSSIGLRAGLARWTRWGVLLMSAIMAAALGTAAWSSYAGAKRAARLVERGEGLTLMAVCGAQVMIMMCLT